MTIAMLLLLQAGEAGPAEREASLWLAQHSGDAEMLAARSRVRTKLGRSDDAAQDARAALAAGGHRRGLPPPRQRRGHQRPSARPVHHHHEPHLGPPRQRVVAHARRVLRRQQSRHAVAHQPADLDGQRGRALPERQVRAGQRVRRDEEPGGDRHFADTPDVFHAIAAPPTRVGPSNADRMPQFERSHCLPQRVGPSLSSAS